MLKVTDKADWKQQAAFQSLNIQNKTNFRLQMLLTLIFHTFEKFNVIGKKTLNLPNKASAIR